jgi:hypothetical protein
MNLSDLPNIKDSKINLQSTDNDQKPKTWVLESPLQCKVILWSLEVLKRVSELATEQQLVQHMDNSSNLKQV